MLYKYLPLNRISYFSDQLLRSTQPGALNDPFECTSIPPSIDEAISLCKNSHKEFMENHSNKFNNQKLSPEEVLNAEISKIVNNQRPNYLDYLVQCQSKRINSQFGIISFSRRWNSSLMWAHYCDSHQGFCVGFNEDHPFFYTDINSFISGKRVTVQVEYSDFRIKIPVEINDNSFFDNSWRILGLKSKDWKYENEVRTITLLSDCTTKISNSPFDIYLTTVPHNAIREILVGVYTPEDQLEFIKNFAKINNIELFRIKKSDTRFAFDRDNINE